MQHEKQPPFVSEFIWWKRRCHKSPVISTSGARGQMIEHAAEQFVFFTNHENHCFEHGLATQLL